jgi:hypothetical protein
VLPEGQTRESPPGLISYDWQIKLYVFIVHKLMFRGGILKGTIQKLINLISYIDYLLIYNRSLQT